MRLKYRLEAEKIVNKKTVIFEWIIIVFYFLLSIIFLVTGLVFFNKGSSYFNNLVFAIKDENCGELAKSASEQENTAFSFTAWTELKNEYASDASGTRRCDTDIIFICGSSHSLLPFGKNIPIEDKKGCIAGSKVVEKLFGTHNAEGMEILWNNNRWVIRQVVKEPSDLLLVQASGLTDKISFDKISVALPESTDKKLAGEKLASYYGITGYPLRWDYLYGIGWLREIVPGKWSDFDGWKQNMQEYKKAVDIIKNTEKSTIETTGLSYKRKGYWMVIAGIILLAAGSFKIVSKIPVRNKNFLLKTGKKYLHFFKI